MSAWKGSDELAVLGLATGKEATALEAAGIVTLEDLLEWFPRRYEDRRRFDAFPVRPDGQPVCLRGVVIDARRKRFGRGKSFYEAVIREGGGNVLQSGQVLCRWFNMPYLHKMLAAGHEVIVFGRPKVNGGRIVIDHPDFEIIREQGDVAIHVDRITPVYRNISGIAQRRLRELVWRVLEGVEKESLRPLYETDASYPCAEACREVHFPESEEQAKAARRHFALQEFFLLQLRVAWRRKNLRSQKGRVQGMRTALLKEFHESLPFDLTEAQKRCVREVIADMRAPEPMNRLLQGDVGSGKTMVAICAMLLAVESGNQAALMAPTQILAEQHYETFRKLLEPLGVRVALVTASRQEGGNPGNGEGKLDFGDGAQVVIGTHALLYDRVGFSELGLVVIDEQHKFGVAQRGKLIRQGHAPDVLVMTATPIPRTLTLTIYGDLDVSVLDELPKGRGEIVTAVRKKPKVSEVAKFLMLHLEKGRQAYLVYPLVEESAKLKAESAVEAHGKWQKRLRHFEVGLLHGKLPPEEKESVSRQFREGRIDALVATTVIEVGVDVPNANIMIVHNAERFGLAQLHQLRGRIGRGSHKSYCILLADGKSEEANEKLAVLEGTSDGFRIAEEDLRLRGPGEVLGTAQSGLGDIRFTDFLADTRLIREARALADSLLREDPDLGKYPALRRLVTASGGEPEMS